MSDLEEIWNDFLNEWPLTRIKELTLEDYTSTDNHNTLTYGLEFGKYSKLGSIKGGSSIKYGIYKRKNSDAHCGIKNCLNDTEYSWHKRFGEDSSAAFQTIKESLNTIVTYSQEGNLEAIDKVDFPKVVKWKLAFLYQNRDQPRIVNIFSEAMLNVLVKGSRNEEYSSLYKKLLINRSNGLSILEFGKKCWTDVKLQSDLIEQKVIAEQFSVIPDFIDKYESWPTSIKAIFFGVIKKTHQMKFDIYINNISIAIGRKSIEESSSENTIFSFTFKKSSIQIVSLNPLLNNLKVNEELQANILKELKQFIKENKVDRNGFWPTDYSDISDAGDLIPDIW